jgi:excisionase family DNA binding protein
VNDDRATELAALLARLAELVVASPPPAVPQPRSTPERVLLTVAEAAERLNLGKTKTYELVMAGEIESTNIGRLRRIHVDSIRAYAARLIARRQAGQE